MTKAQRNPRFQSYCSRDKDEQFDKALIKGGFKSRWDCAGFDHAVTNPRPNEAKSKPPTSPRLRRTSVCTRHGKLAFRA